MTKRFGLTLTVAKKCVGGYCNTFFWRRRRDIEIGPEYVHILCSVECTSTIHQPTASDFLSVSRGSLIILGFVCDEDYHCHPCDVLYSRFDVTFDVTFDFYA